MDLWNSGGGGCGSGGILCIYTDLVVFAMLVHDFTPVDLK